MCLVLDELDSSKSTLDVYKEYFERPFIKATAQYYDDESKQFLAENSIVEYMKKAESRLNEEKDRVPLYLRDETMSPLMRTCEQSLILNHSQTLRDEFKNLLDHDNQEDLSRMYRLFALIPEDLDTLRNRFETYVHEAGRKAVVEILASARDHLEEYVKILQKTITQYSNLVKKAFNDTPEFTDALNKACKKFVNDNKMCERESSKSAAFLAQYANAVLCKTGNSAQESEVKNSLAQIMIVFEYIDNKDAFRDLYFQMLVPRLIYGTFTSIDAEISMINKLKEARDSNYTYALERILRSQWIQRTDN